MACGRAVVVAAAEAICRDHLVAEQHARIVPPDAPERITEAVCDLFDDITARARLGKAAEKQAARFDLGARLPDLAQMLSDATGVAFGAQLPPLEEVTAPAPVARAVPPSRAAEPQRLVVPAPVALPTVETASPPAAVSSPRSVARASLVVDAHDQNDDEDAALAPSLSDLSLPEASAEALPLENDATFDNAVFPVATLVAVPGGAPATRRPDVPLSAVRGLEVSSAEPGDVWAGDTMFDPAAVRSPPSDPPRERVKRAMLNTESGRAIERIPHTAEVASPDRVTSSPGVRSLGVPSDADSSDEWSLDTIADASPVPEPTRPSTSDGRPTNPPRALLVQHAIADRTAEDEEAP
jgi:hypothetical protein